MTGSHTYAAVATGWFKVNATIARPFSGATAKTINSNIIVLAPAFSARLAASSDTGDSDSDGITRAARPDFSGTATPYSVVRIEVARGAGSAPIALGSAAVAADGSWVVHASEPLRDGTYQVRAILIPPGGAPVTSMNVLPLVVDTAAPKVTAFSYARKGGSLVVTFRDALSGMAARGLSDNANFNLLGNGIARPGTDQPPVPQPTAVVPGDPRAVRVSLDTSLIKSGLKRIRILAAGIADVAGNALDGDYAGRLPSGDGKPGGDFIARLSAASKRAPDASATRRRRG